MSRNHINMARSSDSWYKSLVPWYPTEGASSMPLPMPIGAWNG
jgi:hypothetical protein